MKTARADELKSPRAEQKLRMCSKREEQQQDRCSFRAVLKLPGSPTKVLFVCTYIHIYIYRSRGKRGTSLRHPSDRSQTCVVYRAEVVYNFFFFCRVVDNFGKLLDAGTQQKLGQIHSAVAGDERRRKYIST